MSTLQYIFIHRYTVNIAVDQWAYCNILGGIGYGSEDQKRSGETTVLSTKLKHSESQQTLGIFSPANPNLAKALFLEGNLAYEETPAVFPSFKLRTQLTTDGYMFGLCSSEHYKSRRQQSFCSITSLNSVSLNNLEKYKATRLPLGRR